MYRADTRIRIYIYIYNTSVFWRARGLHEKGELLKTFRLVRASQGCAVRTRRREVTTSTHCACRPIRRGRDKIDVLNRRGPCARVRIMTVRRTSRITGSPKSLTLHRLMREQNLLTVNTDGNVVGNDGVIIIVFLIARLQRGKNGCNS